MIIRTYLCTDCNTEFEVTCESGNAGDPDCPTCTKVLQWIPAWRGASKTNVGRAADVAQQILEEDYGMTNFRDNSREGDIAAITPSETMAEREKREAAVAAVNMEMAKTAPQLNDAQAEAVKAFWGAGPQAPINPAINAPALIAAAKAGPQGNDPIKMLHDAKPPFRFRVVARG